MKVDDGRAPLETLRGIRHVSPFSSDSPPLPFEGGAEARILPYPARGSRWPRPDAERRWIPIRRDPQSSGLSARSAYRRGRKALASARLPAEKPFPALPCGSVSQEGCRTNRHSSGNSEPPHSALAVRPAQQALVRASGPTSQARLRPAAPRTARRAH